MKKKNGERVCLALVAAFILSLVLPGLPGDQLAVAEGNGTMVLENLNVGDKVVDKSWNWEFRTGDDYEFRYADDREPGPVTWLVAAKNHYSGGDNGSVSGEHVTLVSEDLIGNHVFDNSSRADYGSNHWGNSGSTDAEKGLRKFLNGSSYAGDDTNTYETTFFDAMSADFQDLLLETAVPNREWDTGDVYSTTDKIFVPSVTELGAEADTTYEIGESWHIFSDNDSRRAELGGSYAQYWTRSPDSRTAYHLRIVHWRGDIRFTTASMDSYGVRPVINVPANVLVSQTPDGEGVYSIEGLDDPADPDEPGEDENGKDPDDDPGDVYYGDVNGDGQIAVADAILILRHIVGLVTLEGEELERAKVSGEDTVAVGDAILVLRYIVGLIDKFPATDIGEVPDPSDPGDDVPFPELPDRGEPRELKIAPQAKIAEKEESENIALVSPEMDTVTFAEKSDYVKSLAIGDFIISDYSPLEDDWGNPMPVFGKIKEISADGKTFILEEALLEDVIEEGDVFFGSEFEFSEVNANMELAEGVTIMGTDFETGTWELKAEFEDEGITLTGSLSMGRHMEVDGGAGFWGNMDFFEIVMLSRIEADLDVELASIGMELDVDLTRRLFEVPLPPIPVFSGVVVYPLLYIQAGLEGEVSANLTTGMEYVAGTANGIRYTTNSGWETIRIETGDGFSFKEPTLAGEAGVTLFAGAGIDCLINNVVGGSLGIDYYLHGEVGASMTAEDWDWGYEFNRGIRGTASAFLRLWRLADLTYDFPDYVFAHKAICYGASGRIKDSEEEGIPAVSLSFSPEEENNDKSYEKVVTDENGYYMGHLLRGEIIVSPALEGYIFEPRSLTLDGRTSEADFKGHNINLTVEPDDLANPLPGEEYLFTFTGSGYADAREHTMFVWDFGDGEESAVVEVEDGVAKQEVNHTFPANGDDPEELEFTLEVWLYDDPQRDYLIADETINIELGEIEIEVEVTIDGPRVIYYDEPEGTDSVTHEFSVTTNVPGDYEYHWNFGNGERTETEDEKVSTTYAVDDSHVRTFNPEVEVRDQESGDILASDSVRIETRIVREEPDGEFDFRLTEDEEALYINGYSGEGGSLAIPAEGTVMIGGEEVVMPVREIHYDIGDDAPISLGWNVFTNLESVHIPEGITKIHFQSFWSNRLTEVTIPNGVTRLGNSAFGDNRLENVVLPDTLTRIDVAVFSGNNLTEVSLPDSLIHLGRYAFSDNRIKEITIPDGVEEIADGVFEDNELVGISMGAGVTSIGSTAFRNNHLSVVTLPDGITDIGERSFTDNRIESLELPSNLETIGRNAFQNNKITSLSLPQSLREIGNMAFDDNRISGELIIPDGVEVIGGYAFYENEIDSLVLPSYITEIEGSAFRGNNLTEVDIPSTVEKIGSFAFSNNRLTNLEIPDGVRVIDRSAFSSNELTGVYIPPSVEEISTSAFNGNATFGENFTIYGTPGSYAETYAAERGFSFEDAIS